MLEEELNASSTLEALDLKEWVNPFPHWPVARVLPAYERTRAISTSICF